MMVPHTTKMDDRLERLADEDPEAKVIGVFERCPVIRRGDGRIQRLMGTGRLLSL